MKIKAGYRTSEFWFTVVGFAHLIESLAASLGLTSEQIDTGFIQASKL